MILCASSFFPVYVYNAFGTLTPAEDRVVMLRQKLVEEDQLIEDLKVYINTETVPLEKVCVYICVYRLTY